MRRGNELFRLAIGILALVAFCACSGRPRATCNIDSQLVSAGARNPANECQACQPASNPSNWTDSALGSPCTDGGVCRAGSCQHGCWVAATFYAEGDLDPAQTCQSCQPEVAADRFSPTTGLAPAGQCDPGQVCANGACEAGCFIGSRVVATGQRDPLDPCAMCVPAGRLDGYSKAGDGTPCSDGGAVCALGVCSASCLIGGIVVAAQAPSPGNPCLICDPDASFSTWLPLSGLAPSGACGSGQVCGGGACRAGCIVDGGFLPSQTIDQAGVCLVCDPARATEGWSALTGIPLGGCARGQVCAQGSCRDGCFIDGGFAPNRAYRPDQVSNCCNGLVNTTAWTSTFGSQETGIEDDQSDIFVGDFDGDGHVDLLVASGVSLGQGNGTFLPTIPDNGLGPFTPSVTGKLRSFVVGDFNRDGLGDLAFIAGAAPIVLLSSGWDAGFGPENLLTVFHPPTALFAADLNGDGFTDLISIEAIEPGYFPEVFLAIGDGGFSAARPVLGAKEPMVDMAASDFDGDGALDLSIILPKAGTGVNRLIVLRNDGTGRFTAPTTTISGLTGDPVALAAGDFNGDGKLDLAVATSLELDLVSGDGQGGFSSPTSIASSITGTKLLAADFNGDGALDLILLSPQGTFLVGNRGDGTFDPPALVGYGEASGAGVADFNGDGAPDLALLVGNDTAITVVVALEGCP